MKIKLFAVILIILSVFSKVSASSNEWKWDLRSTFLIEKFRGVSPPDNEFDTKFFTSLKLRNKYGITPNIKIETGFKFSQTQFERDNLVFKGEVDLFNIDWSYKHTNAVIGRQIISWGRNFFWNPTNWLGSIEYGTMENKNKLYCADGFCSIVENAAEKYFDPNNLNFSGEKSIDAIKINVISGAFNGLEFIGVMEEENSRYEHIGIIKNRVQLTGIDFDIFLGRFKRENRIGMGLNTDIKKIEIISDVSCFYPEENENPFVLASLGAAYNWPAAAKINMEFYYNGYGVKDIEKYAEKSRDIRILSGEINNIARYYMGLRYKNEYHALWKSEISFIYNFIDKSNLIGPQVIYSISDNSEFKAGVLFAAGRQREDTKLLSEFGAYPDNYYIQYDLNF
ncbi:MAG: hypothetical protein ABII25_07075 [bacterium]